MYGFSKGTSILKTYKENIIQFVKHSNCREGVAYIKVQHNYFDLPGIVLTLVVLPLRYAKVKAQWSLAAIGYIFNFLRLFKFANVTR